MTAPDRDALVEKMARAMLNAETWSSFWGYGEAKVLASAALNMAMEEAARVARDCALYNDKMQLLNSDIRATCAAAIRAYISPLSASAPQLLPSYWRGVMMIQKHAWKLRR